MALNTLATLTPSGYLTFAAPPAIQSDPTGTVPSPYVPVANTAALPAGSSPDKALVTNIGPDDAFVLLTTAARHTTGTVAAGSTAMTVASGTSIAVGQAVLGTGLADGTFVSAVSGTAVTLSKPAVAALSSTTVDFIVPVTPQTGVAVLRGAPVVLAYGSNTFVSVIAANGQGRAIVNVAVGV